MSFCLITIWNIFFEFWSRSTNPSSSTSAPRLLNHASPHCCNRISYSIFAVLSKHTHCCSRTSWYICSTVQFCQNTGPAAGRLCCEDLQSDDSHLELPLRALVLRCNKPLYFEQYNLLHTLSNWDDLLFHRHVLSTVKTSKRFVFARPSQWQKWLHRSVFQIVISEAKNKHKRSVLGRPEWHKLPKRLFPLTSRRKWCELATFWEVKFERRMVQ